MGELNYMKQLVREMIDIDEADWVNCSGWEAMAMDTRFKEIWKELKELSGYED